MRKRSVLSLAVASVPMLAVAATSPSADADTHTICRTTAPNVETCHIDQPVVNATWHDYPAVQLRPCDKVTIRASGCVQTGGHGKTWKRYVNPIGGRSRLYYGTIYVPGLFDWAQWKADCGGMTCGRDPEHLQDVVDRPFTIPRDGASSANGARTLRLGFTDDNYSDNGYSARNGDDGIEDQCRGVGNAAVDITIERATSCAPQLPQQSDGVMDGDESDVDCGGSRAPKCGDGKRCKKDGDCANAMCGPSGTCEGKIACTTGTWQRLHIATQVCKVLVRVAQDRDACGSKIAGSVPVVGLGPSSVTGPGVELIHTTATDVDGNGSVDVQACVGCGGVNVQYAGYTPWGYEGLVCTDLFHGPSPSAAPPPAVKVPPPPPPAPHPPPPPPPPHGGGGRTQQK